jgi:guanylate kinase
MNSFTVVISAPSGAGKTTLIKRVFAGDPRFGFSVSTTSRKMRNGEAEGESYYYVSEGLFREAAENDEFLEWAVVHGNCYGTSKKEIDRILSLKKIPILDIDVQGARSMRQKLDNAVFIFILPPSLSILRERLISRGTEAPEQIELRLDNAAEEIRLYEMYDYIVVNDDIIDAARDLYSVVNAEMCRKERSAAVVKKILEC